MITEPAGAANLEGDAPPVLSSARKFCWAWALLIPIYTAVVGYGLRDLRHDDAYITFRYAQNAVLGRGLVFNRGERVLGTTSILQTLVSIPVYAAAGPATHMVSNFIGVAALGVSCWLLYEITAMLLSARLGLWVAAVTALGTMGQFQFVGLETNLTVMLVLAAMLLALRDRFVLSGIVAGLAYLARPDSVLVLPALTVLYVGKRRRVPWIPAFAFIVIAGSWHLFCWQYYGTLFTQSLAAKRGADTFTNYLLYVLCAWRDMLTVQFQPPPRWSPHVGTWENLIAIPAVVGMVRWCWSGWRAAAIATYPVLLLLAYAVIGPPAEHLWHTLPAGVFAAAFVVVGIAEIVGWAAALFATTTAGRDRAPLVTAVLGFFVVCHAVGAVQFMRSYDQMFWLGQRDRKYREIAATLKKVVAPDETVLSWEVGTLAFWSDRPMIDGLGLVTPGVRGTPSARDTRAVTTIPQVVAEHPPDWVVINTRVDEKNRQWLQVKHLFRHELSFHSPGFVPFELYRRR